MKDLISRKQAIHRMIKEVKTTRRNSIHINEIKRLLQDVDSIEAAPVVHGKIIYKNGSILPHCSVCNTMIHADSKYCRECGAKMKVGAE